MASISIEVNGVRRSVEVEPETPLLWVLRDTLGLTGTKFGCGIGVCGACTVHMAGAAVRSCQVPASAVTGAALTTIEGLAAGGDHPCQRAWLEEEVAQCGYCQPGMIMAAAALLQQTPTPPPEAVDAALSDHICRCGTYSRIRRAVRLSLQLLSEGPRK